MESPLESSHPADEITARRRSGRVVRKPELFADQQHDRSILSNGSAKRKRTMDIRELDDAEDEIDSSAESSDGSEGEPDEEEIKEKRTKRKGDSVRKAPGVKKARIANGASTTLAIRSANARDRPVSKSAKAQKARSRSSQVHGDDLYARVFGQGKTGTQVAADWLKSLQQNNVDAIRDLVNFILKCVGCESRVDSYDIEDLDNVPSKIGDILEEYQHQSHIEYPLVSRLKQYEGFRTVLDEFITAVMTCLHSSNILYAEDAVFDNIQTWVATLSGASLRPFRHTATAISLTISTTLCTFARSWQTVTANARLQVESEKKKKNPNKGRIKSIQDSVKADENKLEMIDAQLKDAFDTVYVHRYRDVDDKIRVECVTALGKWMSQYRLMFLEGQYLRYLGWLLSDTSFHTRLEVVKQLRALFKSQDNIAALRAFTDRFRPRIVEMGAHDTDISVRVETIELLDRLRDAEFLEPDDIDTIGRLIFDTEPRVRKAVAKFFVSNIEDLYRASIEDLDEEQFETALPKAADSHDYRSPNQAWIKFKCVAQTMASYDPDDEAADQAGGLPDVLASAEMDSRYMLATQAIFPHLKELQEWESLAGLVLYDHSQITSTPEDDEINLAVQGAYKLSPSDEIILLDVLYYSVKLHLQRIVESQGERRGKKSHASKDDAQAQQEAVASGLMRIIPQLLSKFGSVPQAVIAILRLQQLINPELINDFQHGSATYAALLEEINKQFSSHSDPKVVAEATKALRTARSYEPSKEATDAKVDELWTDGSARLQQLLKGHSPDKRGTLSKRALTELSSIANKFSSLASVADCVLALESKLPSTSKKSKGEPTCLQTLMQLARRGVPDEETPPDFTELEDALCTSVISTLTFYFLWKIRAVTDIIASGDMSNLNSESLIDLSLRRTSFTDILRLIIAARPPTDSVRNLAMLTVLDLYTLFSTLYSVTPARGRDLPDDLASTLKSLRVPIPQDLQDTIMQSHDRLEKSFGQRTKRKLEKAARAEPGEDDAPIDSDEDESDLEADVGDDAEHGVRGSKEAKKQATLLAEQSLCQFTSRIVLAVVGKVMDSKVRARLLLNKNKLGKNYSQVLAYLDPPRAGKGKQKGKEKENPNGTHPSGDGGGGAIVDGAAATAPVARKEGTTPKRANAQEERTRKENNTQIGANSGDENDDEDENDEILDDEEDDEEAIERGQGADLDHDGDESDEVMGD